MCVAIDILLLATIVYNVSSFFFLVQSNIIRNRIGFNSLWHTAVARIVNNIFFTRNWINQTKQKHFYIFLLLGTDVLHDLSLSQRINHALKETTKMMKTNSC